jgi:Transcription elongation factor, N-terminal
LRQFQSRIEATTYEQAWHYPFPESLVAPTGFALEGLRYAKRVYEKTASRRARDARQELHNAEWAAAPQRGAPVSAHQGTPGRDEGSGGAASNGDRSENADYQYGKRRLRQIDGRIRFLTKRIDAAEVVDPESPGAGQAATRAFFGATVRYANAAGTERVVSIVGTDEVDLNRNHSVRSECGLVTRRHVFKGHFCDSLPDRGGFPPTLAT